MYFRSRLCFARGPLRPTPRALAAPGASSSFMSKLNAKNRKGLSGILSSSSSPLSSSSSSSSASPLSSAHADPFLRDGTATSRFFRTYRTALPFPARMFGIFLLGFGLGLVIEVFACKTHLYESVMTKKDTRRHEFDEFVVGFRQNVEKWQQEDMSRRAGA